jgi:hypothetical protein
LGNLLHGESQLSIPEWFDVDNYACTQTWGKKEWSNAIFVRLLIPELIELRENLKEHNDMDMPENDIAINSFISQFRLDQSYSKLYFIDKINYILRDLHEDPDKVNRIDFSKVRSTNWAVGLITINQLVNIYERVTSGLSKNTMEYLAGKTLDGSSEDVELGNKSLLDRTIDLGGETDYWGRSILVSVNVDMPDEILLEQLSNIIQESRKKYKTKNLGRSATEVDLRRWYDNRVLGYYDLLLIAHINGREITNQQAGARLFPTEFDVALADRIRKVVKPLSNLVFQHSTRHMLDMAILVEGHSVKCRPEENS